MSEEKEKDIELCPVSLAPSYESDNLVDFDALRHKISFLPA